MATAPVDSRRCRVRGHSVETELVALDVLHRDARIIAVIQGSHVYRAERDQSCALGLKCGEALFTHESGADPHAKMQPVLGGLPFSETREQTLPQTRGRRYL